MIIERRDIELMVNAIIDERLKELAASLDSHAYYLRDHSGRLEAEIAGTVEELAGMIRSNIEEANQ